MRKLTATEWRDVAEAEIDDDRAEALGLAELTRQRRRRVGARGAWLPSEPKAYRCGACGRVYPPECQVMSDDGDLCCPSCGDWDDQQPMGAQGGEA
jgi:hypothetical protein